MDTRALGATGHDSSVLSFGAIALNFLDQPDADDLMEKVLDAGVNHVDVAPTYGDAELKLAPTLAERREDVFLGCKTQERTYFGAWGELHRSLDRLGVDSVDLYQFHGVTSYEELAAIQGEYSPEMAQGDHDAGALQAVLDAKERGLVDHVGLTSHGDPSLIRTAIREIDALDTVMFPFNPTLVASEGPERAYEDVLALANERDLGTLVIKAFAKRDWPDDLPEDDRPYDTWYEPHDDPETIADSLRYVLGHDVDTVLNAGDPQLVEPILDAAREVEPMAADERAALEAEVRGGASPVPWQA